MSSLSVISGVAIFGDPDFVYGMAKFIMETGGEPCHCLATAGTKAWADQMRALFDSSPFGANCQVWAGKDLWHLRSIIATEPVDFLIGSSYGKYLEKDCKTPLIRLTFPIFDRHHHHRFDRPVRLGGFGDGVNVLCGPNECGKSTVLEAIRSLLFERHTSRADVVRRMQPRAGAASPRLAMEFELPGGRWRVEKRFLHREPLALLTAPDGARYESDAAEERLQELLGFAAPGKQGSRPEHVGLWGALLVAQRASLDQADLGSDLARATVAGCLEAEVGALAAGGERGHAALRAVQARLSASLDGRGSPRGRHKEVIAALAELGATDVVIAGRRPESTAGAVELAGRLNLPIRAIGWDVHAVGDAADAADLVVSTVPAGAPDAFADRLKAVPALFDVVYYPWPTRLAAAGVPGRVTLTGLDMLLHQAFRQFELITGVPAPVQAMRQGLLAGSKTDLPLPV